MAEQTPFTAASDAAMREISGYAAEVKRALEVPERDATATAVWKSGRVAAKRARMDILAALSFMEIALSDISGRAASPEGVTPVALFGYSVSHLFRAGRNQNAFSDVRCQRPAVLAVLEKLARAMCLAMRASALPPDDRVSSVDAPLASMAARLFDTVQEDANMLDMVSIANFAKVGAHACDAVLYARVASDANTPQESIEPLEKFVSHTRLVTGKTTTPLLERLTNVYGKNLFRRFTSRMYPDKKARVADPAQPPAYPNWTRELPQSVNDITGTQQLFGI